MSVLPSPPAFVFFDVGDTLTFLDGDRLRTHLAEYGIEVTASDLLQGQAAVRPHIDAAVLARLETYERATAAGESHEVMKLHENADGYLRWVGAIVRAAAPHVESERRREAVAALRERSDGESLFERVDPELEPTLTRLRDAGMELGIISNAEGTVEERMMERGLGRYFSTIIDSAVVGVEKPYRGIFDIALERVGATPAEAAHIGDFYGFDVVGARSVGMTGILMDPSGTYRAHYPDVPAVSRIGELPALFGLA